MLKDKEFGGLRVENNFDKFAEGSDVILANRLDEQILRFKEKVYSRDLYERD